MLVMHQALLKLQEMLVQFVQSEANAADPLSRVQGYQGGEDV